jgi:hypothetical protein
LLLAKTSFGAACFLVEMNFHDWNNNKVKDNKGDRRRKYDETHPYK